MTVGGDDPIRKGCHSPHKNEIESLVDIRYEKRILKKLNGRQLISKYYFNTYRKIEFEKLEKS